MGGGYNHVNRQFQAKTSTYLDNVAINDVLPLKAARRDAIGIT